MKITSRRHYGLGVCAVAAMLAACGGSTSPSYQLPGMSQSTRALSVSSATVAHDASCQGQRSFQYVGHAQHFKVPKCAATIYVDATGASGEDGGNGGEVSATIPVTPGQRLIVTVGGDGDVKHGGFNGGAAGATNKNGKPKGGGGGGASDVRQGGNSLANRVVVAGGGAGVRVLAHRRCVRGGGGGLGR